MWLRRCCRPQRGNRWRPAPSATPIKHVVFIIKENRTYDNLFGRFPIGDGATTGLTKDGRRVPLTALPDRQVDLQHNYDAALKDENGGKMNGFSAVPDKNTKPTMGAYTTATPGQLPIYWGYADRYALGDRMFSSANTASFPNHLYTVAATSAGTMSLPDYHVTYWGCDGPPGVTVPLFSPGSSGPEKRVPPCFDIPSTAGQINQRPAACLGAATAPDRASAATAGWRWMP